MIDTARQTESHGFEGSLDAKGKSTQPSPAGSGHGFLSLVIVPQMALKLGSKLQCDPGAHVTEQLIAPHPRAVRNDLAGQRVQGIVVRAFWRKVPSFQSLEPHVKRKRCIWKTLGPTELNVVRESSIGHDA